MYERIAPLTPTDFITSVLVPEAVDRLIQADINQGRVRATKPRTPRRQTTAKVRSGPIRRGTRNRPLEPGTSTAAPSTTNTTTEEDKLTSVHGLASAPGLPPPEAQPAATTQINDSLFPRGADPATYTVSSTGLPPITDQSGRVL